MIAAVIYIPVMLFVLLAAMGMTVSLSRPHQELLRSSDSSTVALRREDARTEAVAISGYGSVLLNGMP
jgi:hypothetical protein